MIPIVGMRVSLFVVALPGWVASRNEATDEHVGRACGTRMWDEHVGRARARGFDEAAKRLSGSTLSRLTETPR
jgi:hypothetical protein